MRTLDDEDSEEEIKVLCIVCGKFGHILLWFFCSAEGSKIFQRMNFLLKRRCEMLDRFDRERGIINEGLSRVDSVEAGYSDVCCEGCADVSNHWFTKIWPNPKRAPYRDLFHAEKKVNDALLNFHPLRNTFVTMFSCACLEYCESSKNWVLQHYKKKAKNTKGLTDELLKIDMMKKAAMRKKDSK